MAWLSPRALCGGDLLPRHSLQVQDKFLLALSEEEAIKEFEALLNDTSYFTSVLDRIHSVAQYWRA